MGSCGRLRCRIIITEQKNFWQAFPNCPAPSRPFVMPCEGLPRHQVFAVMVVAKINTNSVHLNCVMALNRVDLA